MLLSEHARSLKAAVEKELEALVRSGEPGRFTDSMAHSCLAGGKRIRPLLLLLSCEAVGGSADAAMPAALAVELLHTFTLVHDDIMDKDLLRRGKPTVHAIWDEATAILAGDGLMTLAYRTLLKTDHPELRLLLQKFTDGLLVLCEGQAMDMEFEKSENVSMEGYLLMVEKKTARLLEMVCEMGAVIGDAPPARREKFRSFGNAIGMAFQIQDDLLDLAGEKEITGKTPGSDILARKKTFLVSDFLKEASKAERDRFLNIWKKSPDVADIPLLRSLFEEAGTIRRAHSVVQGYLSLAEKSLVGVGGSAAEDLAGVVKAIAERRG